MTDAEARALIGRYRVMRGKATPAEYMAYMWARQAIGDALTAGQRALLAAAQKPAWHHGAAPVDAASQPVEAPRAYAQPAAPVAPTTQPQAGTSSAWITEDQHAR